jgi:hypothetical protein
MPQFTHLLRAAALASALLAAGAANSQALDQNDDNVDPVVAKQQAAEIARGDPERWYRPPASRAERLRLLQKELGAALREAQNACRKLPKGERAACLKEARATHQHDLVAARAEIEGSATAAN